MHQDFHLDRTWMLGFWSRNVRARVGNERHSIEGCFLANLAISQNIDYVPHLMARYAWHGGQLSNTSLHVMDNIKGRLSLIERVFSPTGFLGDHPVLRDYCLSKHCEAFLHHLRVKKQDDAFTELSAIHLGIVARRHGAPLDEAALAASLWMHAAECFAGQGRNDQAEDCRQRARMIGG